MMLVRAGQRLLWNITSPGFAWGMWFLFLGLLWQTNHELAMMRQPTMRPEDFFGFAILAIVPVRALTYLHRFISPPLPVLRRRKRTLRKAVKHSLVRVAVTASRWRAASPGEAAMRRRLSPQLRALLAR